MPQYKRLKLKWSTDNSAGAELKRKIGAKRVAAEREFLIKKYGKPQQHSIPMIELGLDNSSILFLFS